MMRKSFFIAGLALVSSVFAIAQDTTKKSVTNFTYSLDGYYRYDLAGKSSNNLTSFTNSANSFELGMASIKIDHSYGKVAATADLGWGRRAEEFSYNDGPKGWATTTTTPNGFISLTAIKQAFLSYQATNKLKLTAGKWATHVGWELVDGYANRNYSMAYTFSYGPFFHTGVKADYALGGKTNLMLGIANPTDYSSTSANSGGVGAYSYNGKMAIAQLSTSTKDDKLKAYLNYQGGTNQSNNKISQVDLVLNYIPSSLFNVVYNTTVQNQDGYEWFGNVVYLNYDPFSKLGFTLRAESFEDQSGIKMSNGFLGNYMPNSTYTLSGASISDYTLSANIKLDNLTIIPEIRLVNSNSDMFIDKDDKATKSTTSFIIAAAYKF